jgi:hypothetical protein
MGTASVSSPRMMLAHSWLRESDHSDAEPICNSTAREFGILKYA